MRILILPISRSHSLLYCHRTAHPLVAGQPLPITERITSYAGRKWHEWERAESGWQKRVTEYGNMLLKRIPHEEWGLKSIPPLSKQRRQQEVLAARDGGKDGGLAGKEVKRRIVDVEWPRGFVREEQVMGTLKALGGDERQGFHGRWFWGSVLGMPLTAPVALVPVVPNLPFFYLAFRAWSHWRARAGSQHLEFLLQNKLTKSRPSELMRTAYQLATLEASTQKLQKELARIRGKKEDPVDEGPGSEELILSKKSGKALADTLDIPALEVEIERAIWQVRRAVRSQKEEAKPER